MGSSITQHKLDTIILRDNIDVWRIFQATGWVVYVEKLQGFNEAIPLEFAPNMQVNMAQIRGLPVIVDE